MTERVIQWVVKEMDPDMEEDVEKQINKAMDSHDKEADISTFMKKHFDQNYGPNWHCCVGKHFASYVTYQAKHYIFFYLGQTAILLYKL